MSERDDERRAPQAIQAAVGQLRALCEASLRRARPGIDPSLLRSIQSLSRSAVAHGLAGVAEAARRVEELVGAAEPDRVALEGALADLAATAGAPAGPAPEPSAGPGHHGGLISEDRPIALIDADDALAGELAHNLAMFGYAVSTYRSVAEFARAGERAVAVIVDLALVAGATVPAGEGAPVIFLCADDTFAARLEALRAGGRSYFTRPVDLAALVDTLDHLTGWNVAVPYRVLIVEDTPIVARHTAAVLRRAGMEVGIVHAPMDALAAIEATQPDLVLMDLYMPGCTGRELAAIIRQQPAHISLPIVFLSGEQDRMAQLAAISEGGDDFLTKPVQPEQLVTAVRSRIQRARILRAHLVRDGLTGLLNHSAILAQLDTALARAQRGRSTCALAVIDLDHFKQVNDTYGHLVGDRVLRSLARLLQQTLRRSDSIGRYGGEEFLIVFPDTSAAGARVALETVRSTWAKVPHIAGGHAFSVTLSAGIAEYPSDGAGLALIGAADRALYAAKRAGRNQIV